MGGRSRADESEGEDGNADNKHIADGKHDEEVARVKHREDEDGDLCKGNGDEQVSRTQAGGFEAQPAGENEEIDKQEVGVI